MTMPRVKRMTDAELFAEGERILAQDQSKFEFERVKKLPNPNPPITIRMMPSLIERLDRLATAQHRKRANLIQHVLWEYVFAQEGVTAGPKASKLKKTAAHTNGKKISRPKARALAKS
jgi:predicted DNA-binding protein